MTSPPGEIPLHRTTFTGLADARAEIQRVLHTRGAILLRGLPLRTVGDFARIRDVLLPGRLSPAEPFAPRTVLAPGIYSSAEWPDSQELCLHPEQSYRRTFPETLMLGCVTPPSSGGATTIGGARTVLRALPGGLVERFRTEGWLLKRVYRPHIGLSWQEVLQADTRSEAEQYCRANDITMAWQPDGTLHTSQRRAAVWTHPRTGEECWFNQISFLNQWSLPEVEREVLTEAFGEDGLPFDTYFGDGGVIGRDVIDTINKAYATHAVPVRWRAEDVLLMDNMLTARGREPYAPPREILVAMG
ncbi:TauD/TfdA family dioxygenase [Amycolatopsis sp. cmx-11-12]|uniref:TauD/TfdA family dioxygenase n=1 Tax=Amycolatopsis sp. cmx-11-12 TaxID=2785795 RepID=UPI0039170E8F